MKKFIILLLLILAVHAGEEQPTKRPRLGDSSEQSTDVHKEWFIGDLSPEEEAEVQEILARLRPPQKKLTDMPSEVIEHIAGYLPTKDVVSLAKVNRTLRQGAPGGMRELRFFAKPIDQINATLARYAGRNLRILEITDTDLEHLDWSKVAQCTHLEVLILINCVLFAIPPVIENFKKLKVLNISSTHYNQYKATNLGSENLDILPPTLEELILYNCNLNLRFLPDSIARMKNLKVLNMSSNPDLDIENWASLPESLQILKLSRCSLPQVPAGIAHLKKLKILDLSGNVFFDLENQKEHWPLPSSLEELDLANCELHYLPIKLEDLYHLKSLVFFYNKLDEANPDWRILPSTLEKLNINDCNAELGANFPNQISHLKALYIKGNNVEFELEQLPRPLKVLRVEYITNLRFLRSLNTLEELSIDVNGLQAAELEQLRNLPLTLKELTLEGNLHFLPSLDFLTHLEKINLSQAYLPSEKMRMLPRSLKVLFLHLGLEQFAEKIPSLDFLINLEKLRIEGGNSLRKITNWQVLNELPQLKELDLSATPIQHRPPVRPDIKVILPTSN